MMIKGLMICFLIVFLAEYGAEATTSMLFRKFANNLPKSTVRLLTQHRCEPQLLRKRQDESVERWTYVSLGCQHLQSNVIPSVICDKNCMDPVTCKKLKDLKGVPVIQSHAIVTSANVTKMVEIPVACKCVPRMKKMKCMNAPPRQMTG